MGSVKGQCAIFIVALIGQETLVPRAIRLVKQSVGFWDVVNQCCPLHSTASKATCTEACHKNSREFTQLLCLRGKP